MGLEEYGAEELDGSGTKHLYSYNIMNPLEKIRAIRPDPPLVKPDELVFSQSAKKKLRHYPDIYIRPGGAIHGAPFLPPFLGHAGPTEFDKWVPDELP